MLKKLIAHKIFTSKQLFRITGSSVYNSPGWSSVNTSQELKTFLSVYSPSIVSIGELQDKTLIETASIIKNLYDLVKIKYPSIIVISNNESERDKIKTMFRT